jgi:steroid 5-alpha reductase family enzyme
MNPLLLAAAALFIYMSLMFVISLVRKDNGTADIAYGWGFVLVALITYILGTPGLSALIATTFVVIWAARLSIRIYVRSRGKPEDFRYKAWREQWGKTFAVRSFFQVYVLQGVVIYLVSVPIMLLNTYSNDVRFVGTYYGSIIVIGMLGWLKGFFFESVGDYQLAKFMGDPANKGKIMDRGLWHFTRHPNYYGESLMWWGIALIAAGTLLQAGYGWLVLAPFIGPILITFLLLKVSGVPLLEAHFAGNPAWEAYKARTSVFIPWRPKKANSAA